MNKASNVQKQAIQLVKGPARILAGPGSGKTFTIIQRILYLTQIQQINPEKILVITFTKAAAEEMKVRYERECKKEECSFFHQNSQNRQQQPIWFSTLHSICFHILKQSRQFNQNSLITEVEKIKSAEHILKNMGLEKNCNYEMISDFLSSVGKIKNSISLNEEDFFLLTKEQIHTGFLQYRDLLNEQKKLDFDDMISECFRFLSNNREAGIFWQKQFEFLLVDEFQDINPLQYQLIKFLSLPENNLFVVGDDDQSIYGFRGTVPTIMSDFMKDFPDSASLTLNENYRSRKEIVSFALAVISDNTMRIPKDLKAVKSGGEIKISFYETRRKEEEHFIEDIKRIGETDFDSCAVIVRTNREAVIYHSLLKKAGIPVKEKWKKKEEILNHFVAADILAFLSFLYEGNRRRDFLKFMNKPNLFLSRKALTKEIVTKEEILLYYKNNQNMQKEINNYFYHLNKASELPPGLAVRYFRNVIGYDRYLKEIAEQPLIRDQWMETADELQDFLGRMKKQEKLADFLKRAENEKTESRKKEADRRNEDDRRKESLRGVSVITMHSAKGLEFANVFLPDINEGIIPGRNCKTKESIEEERRLLYVAITRAVNSLYIYYTRERNRSLSRFLQKIINPHPHQ